MPVLDALHDLVHDAEDDPAWSESFVFTAYDPGIDSGFFTRMALRPNEGTIDVTCDFWLPDGGRAHLEGVGDAQEGGTDSLLVAGVRYELLEAGRRWRVTCDGVAHRVNPGDGRLGEPVSVGIDAVYESLAPPIGVDGMRRRGSGASAATRKMLGAGHLEQPGRWHGSMEIDGRRLELGEARGNRDKSWGPRRYQPQRMWRWFAVNFGDDVHFGGIRINTHEGDLHRGWVWRDGRHVSVRHWDIETELAEDGITQRRCRVTVTDKEERVHELQGEILRVARILYQSPGSHGLNQSGAPIVLEGLGRWEYEGRTGYGLAEYLHQLDSVGSPVIPIT